MLNYFKFFKTLLLITTILVGCNSNDIDWINPLNNKEIVQLNKAVNEIDKQQVELFYKKIRELSKISLPFSCKEDLLQHEIYKDIFNWIKDDIKKFPLLFHYLIYNERISDDRNESILIAEDWSNTVVLLWDLSSTIYPSIVEEMRNKEEYSCINLISKLIEVMMN